eukprot:g14213.t1
MCESPHTLLEWLLSAGGHFLIHAEDGCGDTPFRIAMRTGNYSLVFCFLLAMFWYRAIGRPHMFNDEFAWVVVAFFVANFALFCAELAPDGAFSPQGYLAFGGGPPQPSPQTQEAAPRPPALLEILSPQTAVWITLLWLPLFAVTVRLWLKCWMTDPGTTHPNTILSQTERVKNFEEAFDADAVLASQMTHVAWFRRSGKNSGAGAGPLRRRSKKRCLGEGGCFGSGRQHGARYRPLLNIVDLNIGDPADSDLKRFYIHDEGNPADHQLQLTGGNTAINPTVNNFSSSSDAEGQRLSTLDGRPEGTTEKLLAGYREDLYQLYPAVATTIFTGDRSSRTGSLSIPADVFDSVLDQWEENDAEYEHESRGVNPEGEGSEKEKEPQFSNKREIHELLHRGDGSRQITVDDVMGIVEDLYELERDLHHSCYQRHIQLEGNSNIHTHASNIPAHVINRCGLWEEVEDRVSGGKEERRCSAEVARLRQLLLELTSPSAGSRGDKVPRVLALGDEVEHEDYSDIITNTVAGPGDKRYERALDGATYLRKCLAGDFAGLNFDNAIGLRNQRVFFFFLLAAVLLNVSWLLLFFSWFQRLLAEDFFGTPTSENTPVKNEVVDTSEASTSIVAAFVSRVLVVVLAGLDLCLLGFTLALFARQCFLILTNLTAFEYLQPHRNAHVLFRYRQGRREGVGGVGEGECEDERSLLYYLSDLSLGRAWQNVKSYFAQTLEGDDEVYGSFRRESSG